MDSQTLRLHVATVTEALAPDDKTRWTNGDCHSFALALAEHVRTVVNTDVAKVYLLVGTRHGVNADTRRRRRHFTHAVVAVEYPDEVVTLDCDYELDIDATLGWESKWFFDRLDERVISAFNTQGYYDWQYPDESDSAFAWEPVEPEPLAVARMVRKIDGSLGPTPQAIAYARQKLL